VREGRLSPGFPRRRMLLPLFILAELETFLRRFLLRPLHSSIASLFADRMQELCDEIGPPSCAERISPFGQPLWDLMCLWHPWSSLSPLGHPFRVYRVRRHFWSCLCIVIFWFPPAASVFSLRSRSVVQSFFKPALSPVFLCK